MSFLTWALAWVYGAIAAEVLLFEGLGWLEDAWMARHVRRCDGHAEWRPRWARGWARGIAASLLRAALWPISVVSDLLDGLAALRRRYLMWRGGVDE